ncbi:hypothetical protein GCM10009765_25940 [Fodinicola feengrottensis]|uniref:Uncharacterized protein n=1 Tax=Fodinicola feengrottensis TaxID=435914 RepID=A0ABN2GSG0_9ACTN
MGFVRSTTTRVAAVGAVLLCAVAIAAPASAATGTLTIKKDGAVVWSKTNPAPLCYQLGKDFPQNTDVTNALDATVFLYDNTNCNGDPDTTLQPGNTLNFSIHSLQVLTGVA